MPLPELNTTDSQAPNPVEALPAPASEARTAAAYAGLENTLGISLETQFIGKMAGGRHVPFADAEAQMKQNGYDAGVLPKDGLSEGGLRAIMNQQSAIKRNEAIAREAPGTIVWPYRMAGGLADPLWLAAGPVLGRISLLSKGMGTGSQLAFGSTEGAVTMGLYDTAKKYGGTAPGDHDIGTSQVVMDMTLGGLMGLASKGYGLWRRPVTTDTIAALENSAAYAKTHGISPDAVVSKAGAMGVHQIMPETAKGLGFKPEDMLDPVKNKEAADKLLRQLNTQFKGDGEAMVIAYNDGPKAAEKWLAAGRNDSVLLPETRGYVQRYRAMGADPNAAPQAASHAFQAAAADARVTIEPAINDLHGQHQQWLDDVLGQAKRESDAVTRPAYLKVALEPGSIFTHDPTAQPILDQAPKGPPVAPEAQQTADMALLKQSTQAAIQDAEHAHGLTEAGKTAPVEGAQTPLEADLAEHDEALHNEGYSPEMVKAVQAAVRCGVVKGMG